MLEVILLWIGSVVVIVLGLAFGAYLTYWMAVMWIKASNAWRGILKAESLIYEYKQNRDKYLEWKETAETKPLTIEQLREMDGQPVWDENGKCYLVDTTYRFCSCSDIEIAIVDKNGDVKRYPQRRALYRRPPEEE